MLTSIVTLCDVQHDVTNNNSFPRGKLLSGMIAINKKILSVEYSYAV